MAEEDAAAEEPSAKRPKMQQPEQTLPADDAADGIEGLLELVGEEGVKPELPAASPAAAEELDWEDI